MTHRLRAAATATAAALLLAGCGVGVDAVSSQASRTPTPAATSRTPASSSPSSASPTTSRPPTSTRPPTTTRPPTSTRPPTTTLPVTTDPPTVEPPQGTEPFPTDPSQIKTECFPIFIALAPLDNLADAKPGELEPTIAGLRSAVDAAPPNVKPAGQAVLAALTDYANALTSSDLTAQLKAATDLSAGATELFTACQK